MPASHATQRFVWMPAPPQTRLGRALATIPAVVCWTVLLASCLGVVSLLARGSVPRLDVLSPFIGHFIGFGIAAAAALWVERWQLPLLGLGVIATIALHAAPLHLVRLGSLATSAEAGPVADGEAPVKVMAFNVWARNRAPSEALAAIAASQADIVLLSEVEASFSRALDGLAGLYPYRAQCAAKACKEVVLSRRPMRGSGGLIATPERPGLAWAEIEIAPDVVVTAVAVHVHRPTLDWGKHTRQIEGLVGFLRDMDTPLIVGGDLNVTPMSDSFGRIAAGAALTTWPTPLPSWPALGPLPPQFGIDHILVSSELVIRSAGVGDAAGSDHRPVWSRIAPRAMSPDGAPIASWLERGGT